MLHPSVPSAQLPFSALHIGLLEDLVREDAVYNGSVVVDRFDLAGKLDELRLAQPHPRLRQISAQHRDALQFELLLAIESVGDRCEKTLACLLSAFSPHKAVHRCGRGQSAQELAE